jgi:hypothetical protein
MADELGVITEVLPTMQGCTIFDRTKAFEVPQGTSPEIEHVFRDRNGKPIDLSQYVGDSDSVSNSDTPKGSLTARAREYLGVGLSACAGDYIYDYEVTSPDPGGGIVRAKLDDGITDESGIYEVNWAVKDENDKIVAIDRSIMFIERSLFAPVEQLQKRLGPPTLAEIRLCIRDSVTTNLLTEEYEFGAEEIMQCIYRPIQEWNELPPRISTYTTKTFPHREHWLRAINGYLHLTAAAFYRRNTQNYSGSGLTKSDLDREKEYTAVANMLLMEWREWVLGTKRTANAYGFIGYM